MKKSLLMSIICLGLSSGAASAANTAATGIEECDQFLKVAQTFLQKVNNEDANAKFEQGVEQLQKEVSTATDADKVKLAGYCKTVSEELTKELTKQLSGQLLK